MKILWEFLVLLHVSQHGLCMLVEGEEGGVALLPCNVSGPVPLSAAVEWSRANLNPKIVHVLRDGRPLPDVQNARYHGRTALSSDSLATGNLSLILSNLSYCDSATYTCIIHQGGTSNLRPAVMLQVRGVPGGGGGLSGGEVAGIVISVFLALGAGIIIGYILRPHLDGRKHNTGTRHETNGLATS